MRPHLRFLVLLTAAAWTVGAQAQSCTTTWANTSGGVWTDASSWSNGVPTATSVACVTTAGTYTVTAAGISAAVLRLGAESGTQTLVANGAIALADSGVVSANGVVEWRANYLTSGRLVNRGLVRLTTGVNSRGVSGGATFRNEAALRWEDNGNVYLGGGARFENAASLDHVGPGGALTLTAGGGTFVNEAGATLTKTGGGTLTVVAPSENAGALAVGEGGGTLRFTGATAQTGPTVAVAAGGTLWFNAALTLSGAMTGAPAGRLYASNSMAAGADAVLDVGGTGFEWTGDYLESGALVNRGLVRLTTGVNSRGVRGGATLRNEGTVRWEGTGNVYLGGGGRVVNAAALEHVGTGGALTVTAGGGAFVNEAGATVTKTGGGTLTVAAPSENRGTLSVRAGTLSVTGATTQSNAAFVVAEGATLAFNAAVTFVGTATGAPEGQLFVSNAMATIDTAVLDIEGTGFEWTSNYLTSGRLVNRGLVRLTTGVNSRGVSGGATFRNEAALRWEDNGNVYLGGGARFENAASLDHVGPGGALTLTAGGGTFVNEAGATLTKTGGGTFTVVAPSENAGALAVGEGGGTLRFTGATAQTGPTVAVAAGGTLWFNAALTLSGAMTGAPAGRLYASNSMAAGADAVLDVGGTGFEWTGDYLESGALVNRGLVRLTTGVNSRGVRGGATLRNEGTVRWEGTGNVYLGGGGRVVNAAALEHVGTGGALTVTAGGGAFVNEAGATVTKTGGGTLTVVAPSENQGVLTVGEGGGTLRVTGTSTQRDPTFTVADDGTLWFSGVVTFSGTASGAIEGRLLGNTEVRAAGTATLDFSGAGFEWTTDYLTAGTLINAGVLRLTGSINSRGVRGDGVVFRNEGTVTWTDSGNFWAYQGGRVENAGPLTWSGTGRLNVSANASFRNEDRFEWTDAASVAVVGGSRFENASAFVVTGSGAFRGGSSADTLANEAGAEFVIDPSGPFALGTDMNAFRATPMAVVLDGTVRLEGEIDGRGSDIINRADLFVGVTPGAPASLSWTGDLMFGPDADLHLDLAGPEPGAEHDQIVVLNTSRPFSRGAAILGGTLSVLLADGFVPEADATFEILRAPLFGGGFHDLSSLTVEAAGLSLYPSVRDDTSYVLTAVDGIPTVSGALAVSPDEATNGTEADVDVTGLGFAPDVMLTLECVECADPEGAGVIAGGIRSLTSTAIEARLDLLTGDVFGAYEVVVRDPRGGVARAGFRVLDGPPVLTVAVLDAFASEVGRDPGSFVVRSNRPVRETLDVTFSLSGSARHFADFMLDRLGSTLTFPTGSDSVVVSVFPLNDDEEEPPETVTLVVDGGAVDVGRRAGEGLPSATLTIEDGPPESAFAVYAAAPTRVGNLGPVTITIGGQGFTEAAEARLSGGGDLEAVDLVPNEAGTVLEATFLLTGEPAGMRDIVVESGSGETARLANAVTIESAVFPDVFVQVLAPPRVPRTRERSYTVVLENRGNVSVTGNPALAGLPEGVAWRVEDDAARITGSALEWHDVAPRVLDDETGTQILTLPTVTLAPRETRHMTVITAIGTPQTLTLKAAWMYHY